MSYPKPPTSWVHTWLKPLYTWLSGLTDSVNNSPIPAPASLPAPNTVGASPTNRVMRINTATNQLVSSDGTNWYDAAGNIVV